MGATVRVRLVGQWTEAKAIMRRHRGGATVRRALDRAIKQEAEEYVKQVKTGVRKGSPGGKKLAANRPLVVYRKRSNKPLINHGDLVGSVRVKRVRQMEYFAGVHRSATRRGKRGAGGRFTSGGSGGTSLVNVAAVHEKGKIIVLRVTVRMQRWFFAELARAGKAMKRRRSSGTQPQPSRSSGKAIPRFKPGAILIIRLKPRPFLGPTFDKFKPGAEGRILGRLGKELRGDFGRA